ncbi:hypothetical protein L6R52_41855 [Myxococcota bacterium]|nr:hypothetical protein [Myxococcota bacterium]
MTATTATRRSLARLEPLVAWAVAILPLVPFLLVRYAPIDDGPEHLLMAWLDRELSQPGSRASALYVPSGAPATYHLVPALIRAGLAVAEPATVLRALCVLLPLGVFAAIRANLAGAPPLAKLAASALVPLVFLDISFFKGFLPFYGGLVPLLLARACLVRARTAERATPYLAGLAVAALATLAAHPFAYALLAFVAALELARARSPRLLAQTLAWGLPSLGAAIVILALLAGGHGGDGALEATHLFTTREKLQVFFREGWLSLGAWQQHVATAALASMAAAWLMRDTARAWHRVVPPLVPTALFGLWLVLPEGVTGWSWLSIRVPLLVALTFVIELAHAPFEGAPGRAVRGGLVALGVSLACTSAVLGTRDARRFDAMITRWVAAGPAIPEGVPILTFTPVAHAGAGRVDVLHHASAYLAIERVVAYPEVFAHDPRAHRSVVRPELRARLWGLHATMTWHELVDAEARVRWFEATPGMIAVAYELAPELARRMEAASREVRRVDDRVTVYVGR